MIWNFGRPVSRLWPEKTTIYVHAPHPAGVPQIAEFGGNRFQMNRLFWVVGLLIANPIETRSELDVELKQGQRSRKLQNNRIIPTTNPLVMEVFSGDTRDRCVFITLGRRGGAEPRRNTILEARGHSQDPPCGTLCLLGSTGEGSWKSKLKRQKLLSDECYR